MFHGLVLSLARILVPWLEIGSRPSFCSSQPDGMMSFYLPISQSTLIRSAIDAMHKGKPTELNVLKCVAAAVPMSEDNTCSEAIT